MLHLILFPAICWCLPQAWKQIWSAEVST